MSDDESRCYYGEPSASAYYEAYLDAQRDAQYANAKWEALVAEMGQEAFDAAHGIDSEFLRWES